MVTIPSADTSAISSAGLYKGSRFSNGKSHAVLDKFNLEPIGEILETSPEDVERIVVDLAKATQTGIPTANERAKILERTSQILEVWRPKFLPVLIAEAGFTQTEANAEITRAVATLKLCADETLRINGEQIPFNAVAGQENRIGFTLRSPLGVVCAITPFNSPVNTVLHKMGPAFAAGNAVILKPAIATPFSASLLCDVLLEAGWPEELLALVQGPGSAVGNALIAQPGIDYYAFTGSTGVGNHIQSNVGLRRTQMELGSIASVIVCEDSDIEKAVTKCVAAGFRKAGQVCTSVQIMYIERRIFDDVAERLHKGISSLVTGDPREETTTMGPLISLADAQRVEEWIKQAIDAGAHKLCGGERDSSVVKPTLIESPNTQSKILSEEVFGPLISILPFDTLDEAVDRANATPYGLAAGLFCNDLSRALPAARRMRFGGVHIGEASSARSDGMPFGGVKDSGFGREGPSYAIAEMSEERLITLNP